MEKKYNPHLGRTVFKGKNIVLEELLYDGDCNMNVNGSITPVIYKAAPPSGKYWMISRMLIYFSDSANFEEDTFGGLPKLTNGVSITVNNNEILNWKDNIDIQTSMLDAEGKEYAKLDRSMSGFMPFFDFGSKHGIKVNDNEYGFAIKIQDDLSNLSQFRARIKGSVYDKG